MDHVTFADQGKSGGHGKSGKTEKESAEPKSKEFEKNCELKTVKKESAGSQVASSSKDAKSAQNSKKL